MLANVFVYLTHNLFYFLHFSNKQLSTGIAWYNNNFEVVGRGVIIDQARVLIIWQRQYAKTKHTHNFTFYQVLYSVRPVHNLTKCKIRSRTSRILGLSYGELDERSLQCEASV